MVTTACRFWNAKGSRPRHEAAGRLEDGNYRFRHLPWRSGSHHLSRSDRVPTAQDLPPDVFSGCQHFHVSAYFLQDGLREGLKELFRAAHEAGLTTSLDTGWDPTERWDGELIDTLTEVDVFLPNESEIQAITGCQDVLAGLARLQNGRTLVIGKLGADGCIAACQGRIIRQPAFPVEVVDTTGAGDSFVAGFLHAWLRRRTLEDCLRFASACGALSTRGIGGTTSQPSYSEAESFLSAQTANETRTSN